MTLSNAHRKQKQANGNSPGSIQQQYTTLVASPKARLRKGQRDSMDTSTKQEEAFRKMLVQHAALTPDLAVQDARFELNPYIEEYKT